MLASWTLLAIRRVATFNDHIDRHDEKDKSEQVLPRRRFEVNGEINDDDVSILTS